ncbi:DUF1127 domain-containing protein [Ruegeria arenilitoris]|uniref:DUF1127 domain-containing protein n=1 Tax=Ruegeria arenilitoris TaxID=1173585 RepID=UPI00147FCC67|nr:DUF1127 domain-containing protein [Ruegeria arenilitoris]
MEYTNKVTPQSSVFAGLFSDFAEARVEQFRRRLFSKTVNELRRLSDQQLDDIGVPRDQIERKAYESVYNHRPYRH